MQGIIFSLCNKALRDVLSQNQPSKVKNPSLFRTFSLQNT